MLDDLRLALRRLRGSPGFTAAAVVILALTIGANTSILTIADAVLFRPLPYRDPGRVYVIRAIDTTTGPTGGPIPAAALDALDAPHASFGPAGARGGTSMTSEIDGNEARWVETVAVGPGYFDVLGIRAARGRLFTDRDAASGGAVAMISYDAWQGRFGGDEGIIGRSVRLGRATREVIGVLPADFVFPSATLRFRYASTGHADFVTVRRPRDAAIDPVVRLNPGVTREQAQAELDAIAASIPASSPAAARTALVLEEPRTLIFPTGRSVVAGLLTAALLVLLLGCTNLANLLTARARRREREFGLYTALGATPLRLIRPVFFETLIVGGTGALAAVVLTRLSFDALIRHVPPMTYGPVRVGLDFRVAIAALGLGLGAGIVFAIAPAWRTTRVDVQALVTGRARVARGARVYERASIAVQVALTIVLASGAVVTGQAFVSVLRRPLGFTPDRVLLVDVSPEGTANQRDPKGFYTRIVTGLRARTDVEAAGAAGAVPLGNRSFEEYIPGVSGKETAAAVSVLPGFFETAGMRVISGRSLDAGDLATDETVVSESAARALVTSANPIGQSLVTESGRRLTIVGVVADVLAALDRQDPPPVYTLPGARTRSLTVVVRARARDARGLADLRTAAAALAPGAPVVANWWSDAIDSTAGYRNRRFQTLVLGAFGSLALTLTALGIFAVVSNLVAARRRDLGIRLALGAAPRSLVWLVVIQALMPVVTGATAGLVCTYWLRRIAEAQLFDIRTDDPAPFVAAMVTVLASALVAAWLPARESARIDPLVVLRTE